MVPSLNTAEGLSKYQPQPRMICESGFVDIGQVVAAVGRSRYRPEALTWPCTSTICLRHLQPPTSDASAPSFILQKRLSHRRSLSRLVLAARLS